VRVRLLIAAAAAFLLFPAAARAGGGLETVVQDDRLLLHQPPDAVRASLAQIAALGAERVRLTANWSTLAREPDGTNRPRFDAADPAAYEQARWRGLDTAVALANAAGLRVVVDVGFWAPVWATKDTSGPRARSSVDAAEFADFAVAVARRYSGSFVAPPAAGEEQPPPAQDENEIERLLGIAPPPVGGEEPPPAESPAVPAGTPLPAVDQLVLWNEPNHHALLLPQWRTVKGKPVPASPDVYRRMVMAAYPAVKAVRPDVTVLVGNTSSIGGGRDGSGPLAPMRFLRGLACVNRRLRPVRRGDCASFRTVPGDGWAHHPYTRNLLPTARSTGGRRDDVLVADLPRLARVLRRLANSGRISRAMTSIHVTEFGYETGVIEGRPILSPARQALFLPWAESIASRVRGVVGWAQFLLRDQPPAAVRVSDSERRPFGQFYSGLLTAEGQEKPAAAAFRAGLVVRRAGRRTVSLWGRLRLGDGPRTVTVERRVGRRPWRVLATRPSRRGRAAASFTAAGRGTFTRRAPFARRARYRLAGPGIPSVEVSTVPVAR
jgi:hypothetical protein